MAKKKKHSRRDTTKRKATKRKASKRTAAKKTSRRPGHRRGASQFRLASDDVEKDMKTALAPGGGKRRTATSPTLLDIEIEEEDDGRWIADVPALPGVLVYGDTRDDAVKAAKALALRVVADRLENDEDVPSQLDPFRAIDA